MNTGMWIAAFCTLSSLSLIMTSSGQVLEQDGCVVGNKTYAVGESFNPTMSTPGSDYSAVCYNCTCYNLIPLCLETHCPELNCEHPVRINGECCSICMEPDISLGYSQCIYNNLLIEHGETFHPAQLPANQDDQTTNVTNPHCNECTCSDGAVTCKDVSDECPSLECAEDVVAVILNGTCCAICPVAPSELPHPLDCLSSDGRHFANGESWHPLFPLLGPVPCINCTCIDSHEVCLTLPCPTGPLPPCHLDEPEPDIILCCPTCKPVPSTASKATPTATPSIPTFIIPDLVPDTPAPFVPCDPSHTVKVWKHRSADTAAMEFTEGGGVVKAYTWSLSGDSYMKEEVEISTNDFHAEEYDFQGWTRTRRVDGLTTREAKRVKLENCTSNCAQLVVRFLRPTKCEVTS